MRAPRTVTFCDGILLLMAGLGFGNRWLFLWLGPEASAAVEWGGSQIRLTSGQGALSG